MPTDPSGENVKPAELLQEHIEDDDWRYSPTQFEEVARYTTPERLGYLLREADAGDPLAYLTLAYEIERRDSHYRAVVGQRKMVISQLVPEVVPASDSARDEVIAKDVRSLLTGSSFRQLLFHMMDAVAKGYSLVEILWETSETQWRPKGYRWRDQRLYRVDPVSLRTYRLEDGSIAGEPLPEHKYIVHEAMLASGPALQNGLARPALGPYLCKSYTVKDLMLFLEVYGVPARLGRYPKNATPEHKRALKRALQKLGSAAYGMIPEGMQIDFMKSMNGTESKSYIGTAEYWDRQHSKLFLGQTSSTEGKGGDYKSSGHHKGVRLEIAAHDALDAVGTVVDQLVGPYVAFNYGAVDALPDVRLTVPVPEDVLAWAQAVCMLADRGHKVAQREVDRRLAVTPPEKGEPVLKAAKTPMSPAPSPPGEQEPDEPEDDDEGDE
ncbi:MAG: DUF935 family protein [Deltaproteobacteria bacterium]|nr:DUF935 family protein [Deltaproteobacteria bacterium]